MTSLLRSYELLYIQTAKLTDEYINRDTSKTTYNNDLLLVLQEKFFILVGNQLGSLYLTENYLNSPQSSFVNDELSKISILATKLGITNESFSVYGPQASSSGMPRTDPQLRGGSIANIDYIYSNDFAFQYSYSVRLPYLTNNYTNGLINLESNIRFGIRTKYIGDTSNNSLYLLVRRKSSGSNYYIQYFYNYSLYSSQVLHPIGITEIPISFGNDHIITICNDSQGISFLVNGHDYFGHITSSMTGFDVTQSTIFYATPKDTLSSDISLYVSGYTLNTTSTIGTFIKNSDNITLSPQTRISQSGVTAAFSASVQTDFIAYSLPSKTAIYYIDITNIVDGIYFGLSNIQFPDAMYVSLFITTSIIEIYIQNINANGFPSVEHVNNSDYNGVMIIQNSSGIQFLIDGVDYFGTLAYTENPLYCFAGNQRIDELITDTFVNTIKVYAQIDNSPFLKPGLTYSSSSVGDAQALSLDINFSAGAKKDIDYVVGTTPLMLGKYTIVLASYGSGSFPDKLHIGLRSDPFTNNTPIPRITIYVEIQQGIGSTTFALYFWNGSTVNPIHSLNYGVDPLNGNTLTVEQKSDGIYFSIDGNLIHMILYLEDYDYNFNRPLYFYATPGQTWLSSGVDQGMPNGDPAITLTSITI